MHIQYFAPINLNPKLQFCAKVSFPLYLILLTMTISSASIILFLSTGSLSWRDRDCVERMNTSRGQWPSLKSQVRRRNVIIQHSLNLQTEIKSPSLDYFVFHCCILHKSLYYFPHNGNVKPV